jgi:hypothetical protein
MKLKTFLLLSFLYANAHAGEVLRHAEAPEPAPAKKEKTDSIPQEDLEPGPEDAPQVTITKKGDQTIEEFRVGGKLYMIKVTPKHGRPYYLIDDRGDGRFARQEGLDSGLRVPQWVIKKF